MTLSIRSITVVATLAASVFAQASSAAKVDFQRQIWPILEKRCVECHATESVGADGRKKKPKGGVVLDSKQGITTSKGGKLVVAKQPADSLLLAAVTLPADDDDRMPPPKKGDPLTKAQTDLIEAWIAQGAELGSWTGKAKEAAPEVATPGSKPKEKQKEKEKAVDPLLALQKGLTPLSAEVLATFAKGPFAVTSVGDGSPLLRVTCCGQTDQADDQTIAELLPLAEHITDLDLGRSRVGDAACSAIAKMPRLTVLDLRQTQVGNHGVAALAACKELRSLNLFGTKVGDYGATALASLKHLEQLYLWQTEVTANAVVRLQESLPGLRIVVAADMPEPMAETPGGAKRRAGK